MCFNIAQSGSLLAECWRIRTTYFIGLTIYNPSFVAGINASVERDDHPQVRHDVHEWEEDAEKHNGTEHLHHQPGAQGGRGRGGSVFRHIAKKYQI